MSGANAKIRTRFVERGAVLFAKSRTRADSVRALFVEGLAPCGIFLRIPCLDYTD